ncbi:phytanoyl-CoA dioxygenase family protein [Rhizohabitans arisaemae]|uniref:phytanoyl-CoA dioxygenase family protein n=1 Tax=Rhizohabitans arisaemae TaxID=2720610 RepID=UPI0024B1899B|nr:phytanoyl-CoA dioxygenase family protein [Rhizohabitans arisaemae]
MRDLRESSAVVHDPQEIRRRIAEDGYIFLRGLLDPAPIRRLAFDTLTALQAEGWLRDGHPPDEAPLEPPARDFKNSNFFGGYIALQRLEYFHALIHQPALTTVMRNLFGSDVFPHPRKIGRIVWPTRLGTTPGIYAHQDFVVEGVPDMFTSWIPFVDCPRELGGLAILTGSQNEGVVPRLHRVDPGDDAWATTDYRVGDVLIFHCLTAHAALPNTTERLRLSGDYRWQSSAQEIPADALLPHLHGPVPGWDELSRDWSSTDWIKTPPGLRTTERTGGELPDFPASPFVRIPPQEPYDREHTVLAGIFNNMQDSFRPEKAVGENAVIEYRIVSESGNHRWQVQVSGSRCLAVPGGDEDASVTITSTLHDYLMITGGKADPIDAFGRGALVIDGDFTVALQQTEWFRD